MIARRAFTIGDYSVGLTNGKPAVTFGCPVLDGSNHVQAVVFATLELDWLGSARSDFSAQVPKGATWTEIDRNGTILVRYPPSGLSCGQPFPDRALVKRFSVSRTASWRRRTRAVFPLSAHSHWRDSQLVPRKVVTMLSIPKHVLFAAANRALLRSLMWLGPRRAWPSRLAGWAAVS